MVLITPDGSILRIRISPSLMCRFPSASKPTTYPPLIEASVAGPPSPLEAGKPFTTTVVIIPMDSLAEAVLAGAVSEDGRAVDPLGSGLVLERKLCPRAPASARRREHGQGGRPRWACRSVSLHRFQSSVDQDFLAVPVDIRL